MNEADPGTDFRRTKLVCTIGPSTIRRVPDLVAAGMDVARVNFSHGTPASRARAAAAVRAASAGAGRPVALLADLSGLKIRLGEIAGGEIRLRAGSAFTLRPGSAATGDGSGAGVGYARLGLDLRPGDRVLIADGAVEVRVVRATRRAVETQVLRGGTVRSRAGVGVPTARPSGPSLTAKDRRDLSTLRRLGADLVAQSYVRGPSDVAELRELLGPDGPQIIAKIETRPAVEQFDAILAVADAVMIARGDLGVELPYEEVPIVQKQLLRRALDRGVPTIVATQMLESMISSPRPTRAEASDVANAVFDGADAVMLSGETAIGAHPILAAEAVGRIVRLCEERGAGLLPGGSVAPTDSDARALAVAAVSLASAHPGVRAIACYTRTGRTARILSSLRPATPVIAFSPDEAVVRRLALAHGVLPLGCVPPDDATGRLALMASLLAERSLVRPGSAVVLVASSMGPGSGPNLLEVHRLPA